MTDVTVIVVSPPAVSVIASTVGVQGPPGSGGDLHYTHTQSSASATWNVAHNLGKFPSVTVVDSAGTEVEGEVQHISTSALTLIFSAAFAGIAYLN